MKEDIKRLKEEERRFKSCTTPLRSKPVESLQFACEAAGSVDCVLQTCHTFTHRWKIIMYTWPQFRDGTKQVIVDDRCGVLRLRPADWRGSRRRDQELLLWLGRLQTRTPYVNRLHSAEAGKHFIVTSNISQVY